MKSFVAVALALLISTPLAAADMLADGYHDMYNLRFDAAHGTFQAFEKANPLDPLGPVSDAAAYLFYEFEQLKVLRSEFFATNNSFISHQKLNANPQVKRDFEAALAKGGALSDAILKAHPDDRDALLAEVVRIALHADYLALIDKDNWEALGEIKQARGDADKLIRQYPDCYDAYLAMGVENYLLSQKPAPVRMFLRWTGAQTDKEQGLKDLRIVAGKGQYLRPYAKILLAIAAVRDKNRQEAVDLLKQLAEQFPGNRLFQEELKKLG